MTQHYVVTKDVNTAVRGHEADILSALGISWAGGKRPATCPYPDHADANPSWRWDESKQTAFCTCRKPQNIFGVVEAMRGGDFDDAKLHVVEILGRKDLIREKRGQSMAPGALLKPPTKLRDNALPIRYLASRLGIEPDDTPHPATTYAGWTELPYYDPPAGKGNKPTIAATPPCAVFGTRDPVDGRTHAHRIYLSADGTAKADLGRNSNGNPRDPKKSATTPKDKNTSGCSVWWGYSEGVTKVIVTEGIETGATVAHAFHQEIRDGDVAVAAAVSTSGIKAFQPHGKVTEVVIAADRDEEIDPANLTGMPSLAGESAARAFAVKHYEKIAVSIALPGAEDTNTDWLDVHNADGVDAVRDGINKAIAFAPTREEVEGKQRDDRIQSEIAKIEELYPLPVQEGIKLAYQASELDSILLCQDFGGGKFTYVSSPFGVVARLRYADQQESYGLRVALEGMDGKRRSFDFQRNDLARASAADVKAQLLGLGLRFYGKGEALIVEILKSVTPENEIVVVSRPGWHWLQGREVPIYMTPAGDMIGEAGVHQCELAEGVRLNGKIGVKGDFDAWRNAVEAAVSAPSCIHWVLGAATGFVGPLVDLTGSDSCGLNLSGASSSGKTTAQKLAVSAWSTPDISQPGLLQTMRTTDNAAEALAQRANGSILALDELAHVSGQVLGKLIYMLASGSGKARMTANAQLKDPYVWKTFTILSSEAALEEKVKSEHGKWTSGMAARFADVDVTGVNRSVDAAVLDNIAAVSANYGHAGPMFVRKLVDHGYHRNPDALRNDIMMAARNLAGANVAGVVVRAALPFAAIMVAGSLAMSFDVLPKQMPLTQAVKQAWQTFLGSSDAAALSPDSLAIERLRTWVAARWNVSVKNIEHLEGEARGLREAEAWYDHNTIYLPTNRLAEAAGGLLTKDHIAKTLDAKDMLSSRRGGNRIAVSYIPRIGKISAYALSRREFGLQTDDLSNVAEAL